MASKKRLDVLLTERGMAESRQKAQAIIMAGQVFWDGKRLDKAGASVPEDANIEIHGQTLKYVSRGGLKLEKAMAQFELPSLEGAIAIDSGASTGGFTDCMLQNGAAKVYAVDVGYGQLAWSLRQQGVSKGEPVAGIVVYETDTVAHFQYIAASDEGCSIGALDLLIAHLIEKVYTNKQYIDFGTSTEQGGTYLNEGLIRQKEGFGGRAVVYDTYELSI